jgi:hypothetical protein
LGRGKLDMIKILIENKEYYKEIKYVFEYVFYDIFGLKSKVEIDLYDSQNLAADFNLIITYGKRKKYFSKK